MTDENTYDLATSTEPFFDDLAELYERFVRIRDAEDSPVRSWLRKQLPGGARAIDVGCGGGTNCGLLAERYDEVVGVDISQRMLDIAAAKEGRSHVRYECRSALDLDPRVDGIFDLVLSVNSVFHMGPAEIILPRLRDLVAPGGRLVIVDVTQPDSEVGEIPSQHSSYAFDMAKMIYDTFGNVEAAADSMRLMLHPRWLEMSSVHRPLSREDFSRTYIAALPGVHITEEIIPTLSAAVWHAQSAPCQQR
jgi:SAM-dependent methyltransferase